MPFPSDKLTPDGRAEVYDVSTGSKLLLWPVDANEMLARGMVSLAPPATVPDAALTEAEVAGGGVGTEADVGTSVETEATT